MIRNAFKMQLKPGFEAEYQRRHDIVWPEVQAELKKAGVSDYSIYLDPDTLTLFAFQKLTDGNTSDLLPQTAAVQKWWAYMKDIMDSNPDNSPVSKPLKEVFHMD
jgi:L-rhamnose mutarotase